jgi:hypothetical protein
VEGVRELARERHVGDRSRAQVAQGRGVVLEDRRGYLWENLTGEIAEEFSELGEFFEADEGLRARSLTLVREDEVLGRESDPDKVRRAYFRAERRGQCVKCSNRAREGKKTCQSCSDKASERNRTRRQVMRERMADLRAGVTHHFTILARCNKLKCVAGKVEGRDGPYPCSRCGGTGIREVDGYITCNTYEDGRLGEIFIRIGKSGNEEAIYEQWAISASMALQFGVPVEAYFRKFLATQFEPSGATRNKDIPRCTSVLDYVARYVLSKHAAVEKAEEVTT